VAEIGKLGQLQPQEWELLQGLADQLEQLLTQADSADLTRLLPSPGTPQRLVFLHELIKTEMEIRCRRSKTVSLDEYLQRYPELGAADRLPAHLIYEEYRVRHRYGDRPALDSYRQRFPQQFEQLQKLEKQDPVATIIDTAIPIPNAIPAIIETRIPNAPTPSPPPPPAKTPEAKPKPVLSSDEGYQLLERIGKGQFGEVYRGLAPGGVVVAIKRIFRSMDDESCQRELKALERIRELRHPFLLQTHKYSAFEDRLVIVMELADGSLQDRFKACRETGLPGIPAEEMVAYFREAAEALDFLHSQKLTHRDIKPQNLLLLQGHAKVADFGIARPQESAIDHTMNIGGTPAYMPPEMWSGDISVHSDQYSLALTWYEMRTGRRIFAGRTPIDIAQQHLTARPDVCGVPEAEQKVLLRALAKKPDQRYPNCKAFVQDLAAAVAPKTPMASAPPSSSRRLATMLLTGAFAVTLSVLLALLAKTLFSTRVDWQPQGWTPLGPEVDKDLQGRTYYQRQSKDINGQKVVMRLIKQEKASDPKTFYIMQDKVWNDLYAEFDKNPEEQARLEAYGRNNPGTVKAEWKKGGWDGSGNDLGVNGQQGQMPVFNVTVTEANFFAKWLGGKLPSRNQWIKAAGGSLDEAMPNADETGAFRGTIHDFGDVRVGSGETARPFPVGTSMRDISRFDCRDMAGNGFEWTRDLQFSSEYHVPLERSKQPDAKVYLMGQTYLNERPLTFKDMEISRPNVEEYLKATPFISFRVVLDQE
jgi:serine/threonine protein kinase